MERRLVAHCESCAQDIETIVLVIRVSCCSFLGEKKNYTVALCIFFPDNNEIPTTPWT